MELSGDSLWWECLMGVSSRSAWEGLRWGYPEGLSSCARGRLSPIIPPRGRWCTHAHGVPRSPHPKDEVPGRASGQPGLLSWVPTVPKGGGRWHCLGLAGRWGEREML